MLTAELSKRSELLDELTSDVDPDSTALKVREGRAPTADAVIEIPDPAAGTARIVINNFENADTGIASVSAAVWTADDQSDVFWIPVSAQPDGTYFAEFNLAGAGFVSGNYHLDVYLTDDQGDQYCISSTTGQF